MLTQIAAAQLFAFLLIFCRVGMAMMLLPGFSESYVFARVRLALAAGMSILLAPVLTNIPHAPSHVSALFILIISEILTGLFLGGLSRILISAMHTAGAIIAYQSGLSASLTLGISQQGQDTALGNILSFTSVVLLFVMDLHHLMLRGLSDSYSLFIPGEFPSLGDFADHAAHMVNGAFHAAMQMSAPSLVVGTIMNLGAGILSRLMPNLQIFFIMISPQLVVSFLVLMVTFSSIMLWYMQYFQDTLATFLPPP